MQPNARDAGRIVEQPVTQHQPERRRLWDRRSPMARRSGGERRSREQASAVAVERRGAPERRAADRRGGDRRSAARRRGPSLRTPVPFSNEALADLKARFAAPGPVTCPTCTGRFTLGPVVARDGAARRQVFCVGCGRAALIPVPHAARVLVVEADAPLRGLLREMLSGAGHEVVETDDAAVGLAAWRESPADLVVLDVVATGRMPAATFVRELRRDRADAGVIVLAGRTSYFGQDPLSVVEGLEDVQALRVPVSRELLLRTVQELRR